MQKIINFFHDIVMSSGHVMDGPLFIGEINGWSNHRRRSVGYSDDSDALRGPPAGCHQDRCSQGRPHRHRHYQCVRPTDPLRSLERVSADHHQAGAFQVRCRGAALVSARRQQHPLPAGERCSHLVGVALPHLAREDGSGGAQGQFG